MCGIFACLGNNNSHQEVKLGLERLSYRGYDSAGIVSVVDKEYVDNKCEGHPEGLLDLDVISKLSIGHNRWATHGKPSITNAHPHFSNDKKIALVHNGIIENYSEIKNMLSSEGFVFYSDTDTELIPNLIQYFLNKEGDITNAVIESMNCISGAYAIVFAHLDFPGSLYIARLGSTVCLGKDSSSNIYISSDEGSLPPSVTEVMIIDNGKFVSADLYGEITVKNLSGGSESAKFKKAVINQSNYNLNKFSCYLEKEIFEQPDYFRNALAGRVSINDKNIRLAGIKDYVDSILNADEIIYTGCGSAFYAACIGSHIMENIARKKTRAIPAGELKYNNIVINEKTVLIAVSQSGETADTIGCINEAKKHGAITLGIVNVPNSTIAREVDAGIHIRAGREISVASTKAVLNQLAAMIFLAVMSGSKKDLSPIDYESLIRELHSIPDKIESTLSNSSTIKNVADKYHSYNNLLCIGRGSLNYIAMESALKIKEISYIHAEGYSAAELKHGPLALISDDMPTIAFVDDGVMEHKMLSNIREIKSRGGPIIGVLSSGCSDEVKRVVDDIIEVPACTNKILSPLIFLISAQLLSYYLALSRGCPIDRPRNLAKSVTVE